MQALPLGAIVTSTPIGVQEESLARTRARYFTLLPSQVQRPGGRGHEVWRAADTAHDCRKGALPAGRETLVSIIPCQSSTAAGPCSKHTLSRIPPCTRNRQRHPAGISLAHFETRPLALAGRASSQRCDSRHMQTHVEQCATFRHSTKDGGGAPPTPFDASEGNSTTRSYVPSQVKKASPSRGVIQEDFNHIRVRSHDSSAVHATTVVSRSRYHA